MRSLRMGKLGRLVYLPDDGYGQAIIEANKIFATELWATHLSRSGDIKEVRKLGSGVVTNLGAAVGAAIMSGTLAAISGGLSAWNFHASGTGVTSPAITDYALQTSAGPTPVAGTQTNSSVAGTAQYQSVATLNYTSTLAITEWGLFNNATLSATTGTPFTATTSTGGTVTGTPLTANAYEGFIVVAGTNQGIIASNTTSVFTLTPQGWLANANNGTAGTTPSGTSAYTLQPVMFDHRTFSAFNVVNGEAIQFTYQLTWTPGG